MQRRRQIRYWLGSILGVLWIIQGVFGGRGSIAQAIAAGEASVHVHEPCYSPGEPIVVDFEHLPGNPNDWIGVYPKGAPNDWEYVLTWSFTNGSQALDTAPGPTSGSLTLDGLPAGEYEVRLFFNNSFQVEAMDALWVQESCASLQVSKTTYTPFEDIEVTFRHLPGNPNDWIGIYPQGVPSDWGHVLVWTFTNGTQSLNGAPGPTAGQVTLPGLPTGTYEARLFFDNGFTAHASVAFTVQAAQTYGQPLGKEVQTARYADGALYYPADINTDHPTPVVLFVPGWGSAAAEDYETLLRFIAGQGYTAVYVKDPAQYDAATILERFEELVQRDDVLPYLDTTRFGVVGHSSGGGIAFRVAEHFIQQGWGSQGRFVFAMAPWFAFGMSESAFHNLPSDLKVVLLQFGADNTTDPRIPLTIYSLLTTVPEANKDYAVLPGADHFYPAGGRPFDQMQGVLRPLDALMALTFNREAAAYSPALENGNDHPYETGLQVVQPSSAYEYKCYPENEALAAALNRDGINYCHP